MFTTEKLSFTHFDEDYKKHKTEVSYEVQFKDNQIIAIRNELNFQVEKNSYVWNTIVQKYS